MQLIEVHGFEQTTIESITSAVGVSKGTFYTYFESKESLVLAALYSIGADDPLQLEARVEACTSTVERVQTYFELLCEWVQQHPELVWIATLEKLRRGTTPRPETRKARGVLARCLAQGQQAGEVTKVREAEAMAVDLDGLFYVHFARWHHAGTGDDLRMTVLPPIQTYLTGALMPAAEASSGAEGQP